MVGAYTACMIPRHSHCYRIAFVGVRVSIAVLVSSAEYHIEKMLKDGLVDITTL